MTYINSALMARNDAQGVSVHADSTAPFDVRSKDFSYTIISRQPKAQIHTNFVVVGGMGHLASALTTMHLLGRESYDAVFIVGIAGTLAPEKYRLGDVVVSAGAKYIGFDKISKLEAGITPKLDLLEAPLPGNGMRIRRSQIRNPRSDSKVVRYVKEASLALPPGLRDLILQDNGGEKRITPKVHSGLILGSDWVVDSSDWVDFLDSKNSSFSDDWYVKAGSPSDRGRTDWIEGDIACVDMESFGFFKAVSTSGDQMHAIAVRGISDACAGKSGLEATTNNSVRDTASANAAAVLVDLMFNIGTSGR